MPTFAPLLHHSGKAEKVQYIIIVVSECHLNTKGVSINNVLCQQQSQHSHWQLAGVTGTVLPGDLDLSGVV